MIKSARIRLSQDANFWKLSPGDQDALIRKTEVEDMEREAAEYEYRETIQRRIFFITRWIICNHKTVSIETLTEGFTETEKENK